MRAQREAKSPKVNVGMWEDGSKEKPITPAKEDQQKVKEG